MAQLAPWLAYQKIMLKLVIPAQHGLIFELTPLLLLSTALSNQFFSLMINKLYSYWRHCTTPIKQFANPLENYHARVLAGFLLVLIVLGGLSAGVQLLLIPDFFTEFFTITGALAALLITYFITLRGHTLVATYLLCSVISLASAAAYLEGDVLALGFVLISVILAAALLPFRASLTNAILNITLAIALVLYGPIHTPLVAPSTFIILLVILAVLSLLLVRYREHAATMLEQKNREQEQNLRAIAENAQEGILINCHGKHVFANRYMADLLGYSAAELIGSDIFKVVHPASQSIVLERFRKRMEGEAVPSQYTIDLIGKTGARIPVEITASTSQWYGEPAGYIMVRDMRERLRQDQALRDSEARWRSIAENTPDFIILTDADGRIEFINHIMPGVPEDKVIGSSVYDYNDEENRKIVVAGYARVNATLASTRYESTYYDADGNPHWFETSLGPVITDGKLTGIVMSARDVTQYKIQASHLEHQRELFHRVVTGTPIIIWSTEEKGIFTLSEGKGLEALNIQPGEVVGQSIFRIYKNYPDVIDAANKVLSGKPVNTQHTIGERSYKVYYTPLQDAAGKTIGMIGVATDITDLIQAEQSIKESEHELSTILHNMQDTFYRTDRRGLLIRVSDAVTRLLGYTPEELLGKPLADLYVDANGREEFLAALHASGGEIENYEAQLRNKHGEHVWVSTSAHFYSEADGTRLGVEGVTRNITELKRTEARMQILSSALQQTADLVMVTDRDGVITFVNPAFSEITGYSQAEAIGRSSNLLKSDRQTAEFYKHLWETLLSGKSFSDVFINRRKSGELYYEEKTITPIRDADGNITHFVSTGKDISERMRTQERLRFMAHHDALTELPNRTLFLDRLKQAMARARWHNRLVAVMFMDLDRFKNINDSLGHNIGDKLLVKLTRRLAGSMRAGDTVARFGGDEFAILLDDIASEQDISALAKKILNTLVPAFRIDGHEFFITASIGVSIFPADGDESETLLRNADVAMYRAKDLGRNNFQFYSNEMSARAFERLTLENALRYALKREEFYLQYQPQFDIRTNTIVGVEALLRWQHPDMGQIMPADFISILEETGLITEVGNWALHTACSQGKRWQDAGFDLRISVNLSGRQFNDPDFIESIQTILKETGIDPKLLELELTESMLMRNASKTITALDTLDELGVRLAIDDFGTGYSSLGYLRRFPISTLKIDRSFVRDVTKDPDDAAIATAIVVMAQSLNLQVIAEGVETEEQLAFLQALDCHYIQGFYFSPAVNPQKITELLQSAGHELN